MAILLREWRDCRHYSARELAKRAGVSYVTVIRVEGGLTSPTVAWLEKVARALDIPLRALFAIERKPRSTRRRT
jgi:transcriptional regulator with XRE-family HTH domain